MAPGICYVYEYDNSKKVRNVGFLKITPKYQSIVLQLNLRSITVNPKEFASLCFFYLQEHTFLTKELLRIPCGDKTLSGNITITSEDLIPGKPGNHIDGFFIRTERGQYYAAASPDINFDTSKLTEWKKDENSIPDEETIPEEVISDDVISEEAISKDTIPEEVISKEQGNPLQDETSDSTQTTDTGSDIELHATCNATADSTEAKSCKADCQKDADLENTDNAPKIRKIERADLAILPRRCWNIANNSFLMHGYHNYHHLLLIEENGHFWVGVPGLYSAREAKAAELFGFPQFTSAYVDYLDLKADEKDSSKQFGHWCRFMR